jgi:hypothetical protein
MIKTIFITVCALCMSALSFAQSTPSSIDERLYFEFVSLDFEKYAELHETVKADGNYSIETVCIPAKVICVKATNAQASNAGFKQLATLVGLNATEWQQGQQVNAFDQRCMNARTGN